MAVSSLFLDSQNRAYMRAKFILEAGLDGKEGEGQYVVNNPDKALKDSKKPMRVTKQNLLSIIPINVNNTEYQLNFMDTQPNTGNANGILSIEKRMPIQDVFFTNAIGYFLTCYSANGYLPIHYQFWTYPSPSLGGILGLNDVAALLGIWSGAKLNIKVGGVDQIVDRWMWNYANIPQTQSNFAGTPANPFWDQQTMSEDGFCIEEPNLIVNGGNRNEFTITFDNTWAQVLGGNNAGNTYQWGIGLCLSGWRAQNASSIMDNQPLKFLK